MALACYIILIALAAGLSALSIAAGAVIFLVAIMVAWRHELRATSHNLPHSLFLRG